MRKILLTALMLTLMLMLSLTGCGNKEAEAAANEAVEIFSSGNMTAINHLVFGTVDAEIDNEVTELLGKSDDSRTGILPVIFSNASMSVSKVRKESVEFEVTAPDLENLLNDLAAEGSVLEEAEMLEYIFNYIENAEAKTYKASVPYENGEDGITFDYQNEGFLNAITGGLLNAYKQAYQDVLNEFHGEVD